MFIDGLTNADALPALETAMQFAARRSALIAHNVANLTTPDFRQVDVSPRKFQSLLGEAVDRRRRDFGGVRGDLKLRETGTIHTDARGSVRLEPRQLGGGVLFHDRNNRDIERLMQDVVENTGYYRMAAELLRTRHNILESAISEQA